MPLGERWTLEQEKKWWSAPSKERPPEPDRKGGGTAVIVGIGAAAGILALLGIAAASGAKPSPPPTKRQTSITITDWSSTPYDAGFNYSVQGFLKDENGAPVKGRTIWLYYCHRVGFILHCLSIGTGTTDSSGRFSVNGFHYIPIALLLKLKFEGDTSYYATEYDIELLAEFPTYW